MARQGVQLVRIVELEEVAEVQERQQEAEASPHPRVEALDSDVHVVPLTESLEAVQHSLLVAELQILHETWHKHCM